MSIDYLLDLERALEKGVQIFACPARRPYYWVFSKSIEEVRKKAQQAKDQKRVPINIVRLALYTEAAEGDMFLVPKKVGDEQPSGEPQIEWATVDTAEAAEMMRDVSKGSSPYFCMVVEETI